MKTIKIAVTGNLAQVTEGSTVVTGTVGLPVEFAFDNVWKDLHKTVVFRVNGKSMDCVNITDVVTVPWELLETPGCRLFAGVYGTNADGSLQIPTVWSDLGVIQPGADPSGDESADPSLPVWAQVHKETVRYTPQTLTEEQKAQARANISAAAIGSGGGSVEGAVLYTQQTLTAAQQEQARKNIGASAQSYFDAIAEQVTGDKVVTLFDSEKDAYVNREPIPTKNYNDLMETTSKFCHPPVDIRGYKTVTVRVKSYNDNGTSPVNHNIWIIQYDENLEPISDSRKMFYMHPLLSDGTVYTGYEYCDLSAIQSKKVVADGVTYEFGAQKDVSIADGASYICVFNFNAGVSVDMDIIGIKTGEQVWKIKYNALPDGIKQTPEEPVEEYREEDMLYPELAGCADYTRLLIPKVAKAAQAHMTENSLCLVLFTDTHYKTGYDEMVATKVAKLLAEMVNAKAVLHLGDLADWVGDNKEISTDLWLKHNTILSKCKVPYLQAMGNHDDGNLYARNNGRNVENYATPWEMFNATTQNARQYIVLGSKNGWFYVEDEDSKTRIIFLNSHDYPWVVDENGELVYDSSVKSGVTNGISGIYSPEQVEWLANIALDFTKKADGNEWTAIVCGHKMTSNWSKVNSILTAAKQGTKLTELTGKDEKNIYDYSTVTITADYNVCHPKNVILLRGEDHVDKVSSSYDYPIVTFLNASLAKDQTTAPKKTRGTPTETAVSVLIFDNEKGQMHEVRFGAGPADPMTGYDDFRVVEYGSNYVKG